MTAKYRRDQALGLQFAQYLQQMLSKKNWLIDAVLPIPLSRGRLYERGYNQVGLFGRPLAWMEEIDYLPKALFRNKETLSQVGLSSEDRWRNLENAFEAEPSLVSAKNILIVDDVMTTGATITAASDAVKSAGAHAVYALTLARAVPEKDK